MTNENRTPEDIEREIESQRSNLKSNLEGLQDKFPIETIVRQIGDQFREHGGDLGRSVSDQIKANPIPLALTGIGLAWMMFGNGQKSESISGYGTSVGNFQRARLEQGRPYTPPVRPVAEYDTSPSWARDDQDDGSSVTSHLGDRVSKTKDRASQGAQAARRGVSSAASTASDGVSNAVSSVADAASSAGSTVASGAESVRSSVAEAGSRIAEGTETLTEEGRQRVIAARQKALEMRRNTARSISHGTDAAADFYDRQPLVIGALALAIGAAMGGAFPRTKTEDDLMGSQSDRLYYEAERVFEEEKSKAMEVAKAVKDEIKDIADETKSDLDSGAPGDKTAAQAVGDNVEAAAGRVTDAAKSTAKDENLGKPKT